METAKVARFELVRLVGEGGMGAVHEARDPELGRSVALKLLRKVDAGLSLRLLREAQALAKLQHPNVVTVHEVGVHDGQVFVAMELIDGDSLDRRAPPARWQEVLALFLQAGRGLAVAHAKGIVHRDVKPSNLLVDRDGRVRVSDFGLARLVVDDDHAPIPRHASAGPPAAASASATLDEDAPYESLGSADTLAPAGGPAVTPEGHAAGLLGTPLTQAGAYLGTPRYMAPEQHERRPGTARSDQFSYCVAFWEALMGQHPFAAPDGDWAGAVLGGRRQPVPAGRAPRWLVRALERGLALEPAARHPSMTSLVRVLEETPARRRRTAFGLGGAALVGAALAGGVFLAAEPTVSCARAGDPIAAVWSADARAALDRGFIAARPYGADAAARARAALEGYAGRWTAARVDACRATHERGAQSAELLDRRMRCLDRALGELAGLVGALRVPAAELVDRAGEAIEALPAPESCSATRLSAALPLPDDPRVATIEGALGEARTARTVGDLARARARADQALAEAEGLGHPGLLAEARTLAATLSAGQDPGRTQAALEAALAEAARAGDRELEARVVVELFDRAVRKHEVARIESLLPMARAAVAQLDPGSGLPRHFAAVEARALAKLGKPDEALAACDRLEGIEPEPRVKTEHCRCTTALQAAENDRAETACRAAVASAETAFGPRHPDLAPHLSNLAIVENRLGNYQAALELRQRSLELNEAAHGPHSDQVAGQLRNLASVYLHMGKPADARPHLERSLAIRLGNGAGSTKDIADTHDQLGKVWSALGDTDAALHHANEALRTAEALLGAEHPDLVVTLLGHGQSHLAAGRGDIARRSFERGARLAEARLGATHLLHGLHLLLLAEASLAMGEARPAVAAAERALPIVLGARTDPHNRASAHAILGKALARAGEGRRARVELTRARAMFAELGDGSRKDLDDVDRELSRLRSPRR